VRLKCVKQVTVKNISNFKNFHSKQKLLLDIDGGLIGGASLKAWNMDP